MSRLSYFGFAALIAGLVLTTSLSAQGRGRGGGRGGMSPLMLAGNEAVQKEIGVTDDQKAKLTELGKEFQEASAKVRTDAGITGGGGGGARPTEEQIAKLTDGMKKVNETFTPKLKETLKPEQLERLQQIAYQAAGPQAYSNPEVVKALEITKEQEEKIATVNKDFQEKMAAAFAGGAGGGPEAFAKLRTEQTEALDKVLTKEQAEKWTALKGKKFDTAGLFGGGRGGPGGRPGGRPGAKGEEKKKVD
ncbi:MAG: hypothetical protein ACKVP0_18965 [Pirellulaceae bacterium]